MEYHLHERCSVCDKETLVLKECGRWHCKKCSPRPRGKWEQVKSLIWSDFDNQAIEDLERSVREEGLTMRDLP